MENQNNLDKLVASLSSSEKQALLNILNNEYEKTRTTLCEAQTNSIRTYIHDDADSRQHVRAFITAINFPSTLEELWSNYYREGAFLDIETLLYPQFRKNVSAEWTVPKWAKPGDICMFYYVKTSDAKIRAVQRDFEAQRNSFDYSTKNGLEVLLMRGWHYFDCYAGTIFAIGKVVGTPYCFSRENTLDHWKSPVYAEIDDIFTLENPLDISDFRDVVFITRGGTITPVFGSEFDTVRDRIVAKNQTPDYFTNCSTKPLPLRKINKDNWMQIAEEHRRGFILEQEFRGCYVDYLLQGLSDSGLVYRECRTRKTVKGKAKKGFVDNVIMLNGRYLPVEVKLNIKAEKNLAGQCESYCHLSDLFLDERTSVSRKKVYGGNVLVVDTEGIYLYISKSKLIKTILLLDDISGESLPSIKDAVAEIIARCQH